MSATAIVFLAVVAAAYGFVAGVIFASWASDVQRRADKPRGRA